MQSIEDLTIGVLSKSFWNDESHAALMSRGVLNYGSAITDHGAGNGIYQIALYYITALSFRIFGISDWAGRLPSVFCWIGLVISGIYISRRLLRNKTWISVGLLLALSQIQLAWATQLRPYIWLELFTLWTIYFSYMSLKNKKHVFERYSIYAILLSLFSVLFHGTGLLNLAIVSVVIFAKILKQKQYKYLLAIPVLAFISVYVIFNSFSGGWEFVQKTLFHFYFSPLHYRIFLTHHYWWLVVGSTFGAFLLYKKDKVLSILLSGSVVFIFFMAIFKINPNYVRYSLPAFPLMYILFGYGLTEGIGKIAKNRFLCWSLITLVFVYLASIGKLVVVPKQYYSINADMRENPIVDYKYAFGRIKEMISGKEDQTLIVDAWNDRVPWYLPGQKYIMTNYATPTGKDPVYGEEYIGTLQGIKEKMSEYKSGVVIVEDWQSFMSDEIKDYVRKNLKFEFTVQDLPGNENDHWGISVYSWGL